jgi:hypothetical protein
MTDHKTGTREEWLAARLELLQAEKELTRRSDELARRRQELPWVRIDNEYRFDTDQGSASLADLFRGRSQLLVYHSASGPTIGRGPSCSAIADGFNGPSLTWPTTTSRLRRCRGHLSRNQCRSGVWGGRFRHPRSAGTSTRLQRLAHREATARGGRIQLPARGGVNGTRDRRLTDERRRGACRRDCGHDRNRRGHVHAREAGGARS